jgi:hypothetical protein
MYKIQWQKSSYSADAEHNNCVEMAQTADAVLIRESDIPDVIVTTSRTRLRAFIHGIKTGRLDHLAR